MADELKPCPFCGGAASIVYSSGNEVYNKQWSVGCTLCSVQFSGIGSNSWRSVKEEDDAAQAKAIAAWNRRALSHAAGQEAVAWQCRLIAIATGEVVDDWRECSKESFDVDGGRPRDGAYLRTEYRALYIAPPTTSAEVGQDGEQCRVASGVEEIARQMDAMAGHIQASSPEQKSERLRGWASMLRALSRGVPEGM